MHWSTGDLTLSMIPILFLIYFGKLSLNRSTGLTLRGNWRVQRDNFLPNKSWLTWILRNYCKLKTGSPLQSRLSWHVMSCPNGHSHLKIGCLKLAISESWINNGLPALGISQTGDQNLLDLPNYHNFTLVTAIATCMSIVGWVAAWNVVRCEVPMGRLNGIFKCQLTI